MRRGQERGDLEQGKDAALRSARSIAAVQAAFIVSSKKLLPVGKRQLVQPN